MADRQHRHSLSDGPSPVSPLATRTTSSHSTQPMPEIHVAPQPYTYQDYMSAPSPDELAYATLNDRQDRSISSAHRHSAGFAHSTSPRSPPLQFQSQAGNLPQPNLLNSNSSASASFGAQYVPSAEPSNTHRASSTAYDPAYSTPDEELPNRYNGRRSQATMGGLELPRESSTDRLTKNMATSLRSEQSKRSKYDNEFHADDCPANKTFYQGGSHWLTIMIWVLAIFSTVFSGIYLVIALKSPRWGKSITSHSNLTPSTANVLVQLFGKLIELSFVTVFVTFLGQVLSRRAFSRQSKGISLSELSMRQWIFQPGTVLTHPATVKYAGVTFLGALSLTVMILSVLYTTAATALVTPTLRFGQWEPHQMYGIVKTTFANLPYLSSQCETPVSISDYDEAYSKANVGTTCLTIDHAAQSFHNYQQFMARWTKVKSSGNGTAVQKDRVPGYALYQQNTTVHGSWINTIDTKEVSKQFNRIVNNVTLAMPHVGVFSAAQDPMSDIMQPEDLDGIGSFNIRASVPSPFINVLCANVEAGEIKDIVYQTAFNKTLNATADLPTAFTAGFDWAAFPKKRTPMDTVFGWSEENPPPVFYKLPIAFNTILNNTILYGRDSIYLLGRGGANMKSTSRDEYLICRFKAGLTPNCSTTYNAVGKSGEMSAHCEDPNDPLAFIRGNSSRQTTTNLDWVDVSITAYNALSLNNGVTNGGASNARLLMQLMLQDKELNPSMPSPAEALAIMGGSTLLMSAQDAPFVEFWNYTTTTLTPGETQQFDAIVRAQEFASGGSAAYQRGFHVVLLAVFLLNVFVLIYMIVNRGLVTDFSEPPNLFSLAINSPPNRLMKGSCGAGPEGSQFAIKWAVEMEGEHLYITDKQSIYPIGQPASNMRGGAGGTSWISNIFRRKGGKYNQAPSEIEMGGSTGYQYPQQQPPPVAYQGGYVAGQPDYASAPTAYMGVPVTYQGGQAVYAGPSQAHVGAQQEEDDVVMPMKSGSSKEVNIARKFSLFAKRKSYF